MKKIELLNRILNTTKEKVSIMIENPAMRNIEYITFFREDFGYKTTYIENAYNDNRELKHNKDIKMVGIID